MGVSRADNSVKNWRNWPLAIPNQISTIAMHIPSLVKIHWSLLKLSSGNENMGVSRADNSLKNWRNLPISNPKPDLHNINAHTKFGENPLMFTQVIIRKRNGWTDVQQMDRQMDRLTDDQSETIIPRHYCVVGYKNGRKSTSLVETKKCYLISWYANEEELDKMPLVKRLPVCLSALTKPLLKRVYS